MTTINDLSVASSVSSDDKLPIWQNANGVTRALPISVLDGRYLTADDIAQLAVDAKVEMFISSILPNPLGLPTFVAGTTTSLTLENEYYSADNIEPFFDASFQGPDQYSLVGFGLNFNAPIPLGVQMVYVRGGAARVIGAPSDGTVTDSSIASGSWVGNLLGNTVIVVRNSIAQLRALDHTKQKAAFVTGYYNPFDGGGGPYFYDPTDTSSADNGGNIIVAADGARWKLQGPADWCVEQFGGGGIGGGADDAVYINKAIAALPARGGTVRLLGKQYNIATAISIGDGNAGATPSTKNGIKLIGMGGGFGTASPAPTIIQATASITGPMLRVTGAITDVHLKGFKLYANLLAQGCLYLAAASGTQIENVSGNQYLNFGMWWHGGDSPTGNYNINNQINNCFFASTSNSHSGLFMDGNASVFNDTWLTSFNDCRFDTTNSSNSNAGYFAFVDNVTFSRCHFVGDTVSGVGEPGCYGIYLNAVGNNSFPSGLAFKECSIISTFVNETTDKIGIISFMNYGVDDHEIIPTHSMLRGFTVYGHPFNGWGT